MKKGRLIAIVALLLLVLLLVVSLVLYGRRGSDGPIASVKVHSDPRTGTVIVVVTDTNGNLRAGVEVATESSSGTTEPVKTGSYGVATIHPGESEVLGLQIDDKEVWATPYKGSALEAFFSPSTGLRFEVKLKN